jgi:hypothetical protein
MVTVARSEKNACCLHYFDVYEICKMIGHKYGGVNISFVHMEYSLCSKL